MKEFLKRYTILVSLTIFVLCLVGLHYSSAAFPRYSGHILFNAGIRLFWFGIIIGIMLLMGAKDSLKSMRGFGATMCKSGYLLIPQLILVANGMPYFLNLKIPDDIVVRVFSSLAFCFSVGLFEEALLRGILFNGFLKQMGSTRKGLIWSAVISSLLFGALHVRSYLFGGDYDMLGSTQAILKIIQSAEIGFVLAALYAANKNFWALATIHALYNLISMQSDIFSSKPFWELFQSAPNYIHDGSSGVHSIILLSVFSLFTIPAVVMGVRCLLKVKLPEYGAFKERKRLKRA